MSKLYVNDKEYDLLIKLIEDAMLTRGELDSEWYECAESLLIKLGYPEIYRKEIILRVRCESFRFNRPRCCQEEDVKNATVMENTRILNILSDLLWDSPPNDDCYKKLARIEKAIEFLRISKVKNDENNS